MNNKDSELGRLLWKDLGLGSKEQSKVGKGN